MMDIRFWGVRGSIATAGEKTLQVGGNTSCVEVRAGGELIILDAGTGLRALGAELVRRGGRVEASLLLSHFHWDHIQGFPFFAPAYVPGNRLAIHGAAGDLASGAEAAGDTTAMAGATVQAAGDTTRATGDAATATAPGAATGSSVRQAFAAQMRPPHFPVSLDVMRAALEFHAVTPGVPFRIGAATVRAAAARHPNGCLAWRIDAGGRSVVYATDTEHDDSGEPDARLLALARGADVLIYDAQYTAEEYRAGKVGWGHSTAEEGARLARAAGVGRLVLFHHDPGHDDWEVARIEAETRRLFPDTLAAREGLHLALDAEQAAA